jgi:His/Glu/Gln/Arg/opine family amino acid ABC transporter permease subunit
MFSGFWANIQDWMPALLRGAWITLALTIVISTAGTFLGCLLAIVRIARIPVVNVLLVVYVEMFRGVPAIVLLFFVYFGLPAAGFQISTNAVVVGTLALSLQHAAYASEVFRAAILAVDPGQLRAASSLGMNTRQAYQKVILPQAFLIALPTLGGFAIAILKETSLLSFISVADLLKAGNDIVAATYLSFQVYALVGVMYIVMSLAASKLMLALELRLRHDSSARSAGGRADSAALSAAVHGPGIV